MSKKGKTFPDFNMSSCYQIQAKVIAVIEMVDAKQDLSYPIA